MNNKDRLMLPKLEYDKFRAWCEAHESEIIESTGEEPFRYFYTTLDDIREMVPKRVVTAASFPRAISDWLVENCPLGFVVDALEGD